MTRLVHDLLDEAAAAVPAQAAVISAAGSLSYGQLQEDSLRLAGWLARHGVERGGRVLVVLPNGAGLVTSVMAASRLGAPYVVVNPSTKPFQLRHIVQDCSPSAVIAMRKDAVFGELTLLTQPELAEAVVASELAESRVISSDVASLIYTSGSTGMPKAVVSSHRNVLFATQSIQSCLALQARDVIGVFVPMSFDYGLYQIFLAFSARATLAVGTESDVGPGLLAQLRQWNVNVLPVVPPLAEVLLKLSGRPAVERPLLRVITNTGAHLQGRVIRELQDRYPASRIFVMFGLTECKRVSILAPEHYPRKPISVGRALPDTECFVVDPDGRRLGAGEIGELVVRGPHVMLGYWGAPQLTAERYRSWGPSQERVLFTGDLCSMDDEGFLFFHGRLDETYKQRGFRVSAAEVELAALDISGVKQAALLPPSNGCAPTLFVSGEAETATVLQELRARLEDFKLPERVIRVDRMPTGSNGKTDKSALRGFVAGAGAHG